MKNIPRKRLKFDKSQAAVAETCDQNGGSNETEEPKRHIDQILEENASKNNLSTINVKSIIHVSTATIIHWRVMWGISKNLRNQQQQRKC